MLPFPVWIKALEQGFAGQQPVVLLAAFYAARYDWCSSKGVRTPQAALTHPMERNAPIIKIWHGIRINFVSFLAPMLFELSNLDQPFPIGYFCVELAIQQVLRRYGGFLAHGSTVVVLLLSGRTNIFGPVLSDLLHFHFSGITKLPL